MTMVTCPCCHGERFLYAFEQEHEPTKHECCHCEGSGEVEAGSDGSTTFNSPDLVQCPATLQRHELTRSAKRDHLAERGYKPADIEKILASLYP